MKRDNYYIAVDDEWGKRAWLYKDEIQHFLTDQEGMTPFDEYGQMQGTGFTLKQARKWAPEAKSLSYWDGRPGQAKIFRLSGGKLVKVPLRARRKPAKAGRTIKA